MNLEKPECIQLLKTNYISHLAYIYKDRPFVTPISYYYDEINNTIIGYSGEGHKIKALRIYDQASIEVANIESMNHWKSVLVQGTYEELSGSHSKSQLHIFSNGIKKVIKKNENRNLQNLSEFSGKIYNNDIPIIFLIKIEEISGKQRNHQGL